VYTSPMASTELLLHPVRLRILKAFLGDRALTTTQLRAELKDVPAGSLYRHVALLTRAGVLHVVAERQARGAVERTYTLRLLAAQAGPGEISAMTPEEHGRAFMAFVAGLLDDFDRYLAAGQPDFVRDRVSYSGSAVWLTDAEYADFLRDVRVLMQPRLANSPAKGRRRRMVASVFLPAHEKPAADGGPKRRTGPPRVQSKRSS
jgi:DNA-binding transcriptional ArsR family regulator